MRDGSGNPLRLRQDEDLWVRNSARGTLSPVPPNSDVSAGPDAVEMADARDAARVLCRAFDPPGRE